jgi:aconitate hydratase
LIAKPSSPGNVVPVADVAGKEVYQSYIGSSANPGLRDFGVPAMMVDGRIVDPAVSFDVNPTSRQILENMTELGYLRMLVRAGARLHQTGCNGCIGMGQAPATGRISLRTVPRNFPGRSGTKEDQVYLCSPETATAAAITGVITDPRELDMKYPVFKEPKEYIVNTQMLEAPPKPGTKIDLAMGPNIKPLPDFLPLAATLSGPVLIKVGDNVSTDEILPAGTKVLPFRSNIPEISRFAFSQIDESYSKRALEHKDTGHFVVGGSNYGQGSSREHAAIAPRYLGVRAVIAKGFARIHWQNLANFGILPLTFDDPDDYEGIDAGDSLEMPSVREEIQEGDTVSVTNGTQGTTFTARHTLTKRQIDMILTGSLLTRFRKAGAAAATA